MSIDRGFIRLAAIAALSVCAGSARAGSESPAVEAVPGMEADDSTAESLPEILEEFRSGIRSNWRKISSRCDDLVVLHDEMPGLPKSSMWRKDQGDQRERIKEQLAQIRSILLSTDARKMLAAVESIDAEIKAVKDGIGEAWDKKFLNPGKEAKYDEPVIQFEHFGFKYDAQIEKYEARRRALESRREEAVRRVRDELDAIGLRMTGEAAEKCLFTVNIPDLIDAAVLAKHVEIVVEALGEQMKARSGDVDAAKRYYGVYMAMIEVQKACFDEYLEKSRNGPWRRRLADIRRRASEQRSTALDSAGNHSFTESQRMAFRSNAAKLELTQRAVDAYSKVLDRHEAVIARKAEEAGRMLALAENSFATVSLAGDFLSLVRNAEDAFDELLKLELPPLELFDDSALQTEFTALTEKLK